MSSRFTQFANNGWKLTNELGYILQDRAFSVVQARKVVACSDCLCPVEQDTCLRLPCNLLQQQCSFRTLPLYDAETRAPFRVLAGTLLKQITIMKRPGACLDPELQFMLGTIAGNGCASECEPQRWASESCPISGAQLQKCGVIQVDATKKYRDGCPAYLCASTSGCGGACGPAYDAQSAPCDGGVGDAAVSGGDSACVGEDGCPCVTVDDNGCTQFTGSCYYAGEFANSLIGITLLSGSLAQDDILISVKSVVQCCTEGCDDDVDECAGVPQFQIGSYGGF